jgi:predicted protein tyrosine phosphatase
MNILFVCTANKLQSPTAAALFSGREDMVVRSAGVDPEAPSRLDDALVAWADKVYVMETVTVKRSERNSARAWAKLLSSRSESRMSTSSCSPNWSPC